MTHWIFSFTTQFNPQLADVKNPLQKLFGTANVLGALTVLPLIVVGTVWQWYRTEWSLVLAQWWLLLILWAFYFLFRFNAFRLQLGILRGNVIYSEGSLTVIVSFAALLLFGPAVLWLETAVLLIIFLVNSWRIQDRFVLWNNLRNAAQQLALILIGGNVALWVYEQLNGRYPFPGFDPQSVLAASITGVMLVFIPLLIMLSFFGTIYFINSKMGEAQVQFGADYYRNGLLGILIPSAITFFGILTAGIYAHLGMGVLLFFLIAAVGAAVLASQLSRSNARMEQRSRELAILERMGQTILKGPMNTAVLPELLNQFIPDMFPGLRMRIWLLPDRVLYERSIAPLPETTAVNPLLDSAQSEPIMLDQFVAKRSHITNDTQQGVALPILTDQADLLGGILFISSGDGWRSPPTTEYFPSMQALAGQIAAAIQRVERYKQSIASEKMAQELEIAGKIQASFLPTSIPKLPGWQLTATIEPARQTSGDFYDFVEVGNGRLAIIVADVADKGTGAALYMALSRTLIRTYAMSYPDQPAEALRLANERILEDTQSDQFVTVFFALLDTHTQQLHYANAGHNPALVFSDSSSPQLLTNTGIPLGMFEGMEWQCHSVSLAPGDMLLLYTDGVTEAQNTQEAEFGEAQLIDVVNGALANGRSVQTVETAVLDALHAFVGDAPQFDDITLLIAARTPPAS